MAASGILAGRLALVTGGGSGIGRAVCYAFATEGARVVVADINDKAAQETINSLTGGMKDHYAVKVDVSMGSSVMTMMDSIHRKYSTSPCIVVNCAGITRDSFITKMSEEMFDEVINVNLKGTFLITQAASIAMIKEKVKSGSIIHFGSIVGKVGNLGQCNYSASKAGIEGITKTAAKELARHGIRCNAVIPGFIETPMVDSVPDKVIEKFKTLIPLGRMGKPEELADVCVYLASEKSSFITGSSIEVTGGMFS